MKFLRLHVDGYILRGTNLDVEDLSRILANEGESLEPPPNGGIQISCEELCDESSNCNLNHGIMAKYIDYSGACNAICPYRPNHHQTCIQTLGPEGVESLMQLFYPLDWEYRYSKCELKKGDRQKKCFEAEIYGECEYFKPKIRPGKKYCRQKTVPWYAPGEDPGPYVNPGTPPPREGYGPAPKKADNNGPFRLYGPPGTYGPPHPWLDKEGSPLKPYVKPPYVPGPPLDDSKSADPKKEDEESSLHKPHAPGEPLQDSKDTDPKKEDKESSPARPYTPGPPLDDSKGTEPKPQETESSLFASKPQKEICFRVPEL